MYIVLLCLRPRNSYFLNVDLLINFLYSFYTPMIGRQDFPSCNSNRKKIGLYAGTLWSFHVIGLSGIDLYYGRKSKLNIFKAINVWF